MKRIGTNDPNEDKNQRVGANSFAQVFSCSGLFNPKSKI